jgi:putative transposase
MKTSVKAWISDITYIQTKEGFVYLTTIMDLYDRNIIGWSLSYRMRTDKTTLGACKIEVENRNSENRLFFYSEYASKKFVNILNSFKKNNP